MNVVKGGFKEIQCQARVPSTDHVVAFINLLSIPIDPIDDNKAPSRRFEERSK